MSVAVFADRIPGTCELLEVAAGERHPDSQHGGWPTAPLVSGRPGVDEVYDVLGMLAAAAAPTLGVDLDQANYIYGKVLEYPPGAGLDWHTDVYTGNANGLIVAGLVEPWQIEEMEGRMLSIMVQLSEPGDYTGGELDLIDDDGNQVTAPTERGTITVATVDVEHRVREVETGRRLSLVCFLGRSPRGEDRPSGWSAPTASWSTPAATCRPSAVQDFTRRPAMLS